VGVQNCHGKLGAVTEVPMPISLYDAPQLQSRPEKVSAGGFHTFILIQDEKLWAAGSRNLGIGVGSALGHATRAVIFHKVCVADHTGKQVNVIDIAAGRMHSALVMTDQCVMTCGQMQHAMTFFLVNSSHDSLVLSQVLRIWWIGVSSRSG